MTFTSKVVTRVFKISLQKININRTQRISSIVLSKPSYYLTAYNKSNFTSTCKKIHKVEQPHSVYNQVRAMGGLSPMDPSSYSRPELALVKHVSLSLNVDFEKKVLRGFATLNIDVLDNITEVILDSSKLNIESVENDEGKSLKFHIGEEVPNFGSKLTITLDQGLRIGSKWLKGECKQCIELPAGRDDINLTYTGYMYKPDIFDFCDNAKDQKPRCEHHCVYYNKVKNTGQFLHYKHRKVPDSFESETGYSEVIFEPRERLSINITQRGEYYILGPHGSHHRVTTREELKQVPPDCGKQLGMIDLGSMPTQTGSDLGKEASVFMGHVLNDDNVVSPRSNYADSCPSRLKKLILKIKYSTSPEASALQWLDPAQTSGKTLPFMFSQCQPIHARSILPCQDTPAVKFTYEAEVTAAPQFTVLMSALRGDVRDNTTSFRQPMPLPSYLLAIAVGALDSKYLGPRSRVWSEKEILAKSAWEFGETERYLQAAEQLCGRYQWSEYDLLVLPASFPYGGMENPCLTFVTPTLLAGDRSLADVIVHEIMHSWTGNLVTNRNFEHFWLNEGFTVYLERKVTASLVQDPAEAKKTRDFHSILGLQELTEAINTLGAESPMTVLVPDLEAVHPDDAFSRVPYEKGSLFLRYLEDLLGGAEVFDEFLRSYLTNYSKKSLDTTDFKAYLYKHFQGDTRLDKVDWETWLNKPGMPPVIPNYDTSMTQSVDSLVGRIASSNFTFSIRDIQDFKPQQMIYFLQKLVDGPPVPPNALKTMESEYKLNESRNAEIRYRLMRMCIKSEDQSRLDEVFEFLNSQGRMKYVRPIYRDLYAWDYARESAIANFLKNEKYMMHVSAYTLRKDLHLND